MSHKRTQDLPEREYERLFMSEVGNFLDAEKGVPPDDIDAALLLIDTLHRLRQRQIRVTVTIDEDTELQDLLFVEVVQP